LLKLRKVELVGFKSFFEKTQITFSGSGLTCIIGPNGCGKSNVVDAISWVLGEQSHKSLRAERMSDCIFNGTAKRPPLGLAEVTLTLVDPDLADAARFVLEGVAAEAPSAGPVGVPAIAQMATGVPAEPEGDTAADGGAETAAPALLSAQGQDNGQQSDNNDGPASDGEAAGSPASGRHPKLFGKARSGEKPAMQLKPGEVVVGRRLYRSGQSEYLINGRVARLRDVQELFMGIGLGPDSYAIIEQGRIGQILSSKPTDRRAIIEEAAGITKFKTKRRLSEARLESSKVNLSRVNDIVVEVEKQLGSLKRQASKARRYAEIREQMRGLLRQVLASKAKKLDLEAERLSGLLRDIAQNESGQTQSLSQMEGEEDRLGARTLEVEAALRQHQNLLGQTALELDRSENRIVFSRQRAQELATRRKQLAAEIEQASAQRAQLESRATGHRAGVTALQNELASLESVLATLTAACSQIAGSQESAEDRIAHLRRTAADLADELTRLHGEQAQAEQSLARYAAELEQRGIAVEKIVREGYPAAVIVDEAASQNADLIVIGTHGLSGLKHMLLGSIAERVVQKAPCPVLTVKASSA